VHGIRPGSWEAGKLGSREVGRERSKKLGSWEVGKMGRVEKKEEKKLRR